MNFLSGSCLLVDSEAEDLFETAEIVDQICEDDMGFCSHKHDGSTLSVLLLEANNEDQAYWFYNQ